MSRAFEHAVRLRTTQWETVEERLVLSAAPLHEVWTHELTPVELPALHAVEANSVTQANTGVDYIHGTYGFSGAGQTVVVIDSGVAYNHQALGGGFGSSRRVVGGWDFTEENDADPYDDGPAGFHGTHVAGIIASDDPLYTGVAPEADIVALRVFNDQGAGYFEWIERALQWTYDHRDDFEHPITTVNLSLGANWNADAPPSWAMLEDEFQRLHGAGIFIAVSAGNSFASFNAPGVSYPAASPWVVPVASVNAAGQLSAFSQRNDRVLAAPGEQIISTVPDHVFGSDGVYNDYAIASGTSMASPFVAGASVLVRQAMEFAGRTQIDQDDLYQHLRNTSDVIWDSVTGANYFRINVGRAVDALMPSDDFGDTAGTAFSLGVLQQGTQFDGVVSRLNDVDYFTFTAAATGRLTLTATGDFDFSGTLQCGAEAGGARIAFDVVAGQSYTLRVASADGIGRYQVASELVAESPVIDLGAVQLAQRNVAGDTTFALRAARDGILTVEARFSQSQGNVDLELYNAQHQLVASARSLANVERIDITALRDEHFTLVLRGANENIDLRVANLVRVSGSAVTVFGMMQDDRIVVRAGNEHVVVANDLRYVFDAAQVTQVSVLGRGGNDYVKLIGSAGDDTANAAPLTGSLVGRSYVFSADAAESVHFDAGAGNDRAVLWGSAGDDRLTLSPVRADLSGAGYFLRAAGFDRVVVRSEGGHDTARLDDGAGDELLTATPTETTLQGAGFNHAVRGFSNVAAFATAGGYDRAVFYDSPGDDEFLATQTYAYLRGDQFYNEARQFERVVAISSAGGNDVAELLDAAEYAEFRATSAGVTGQGEGFFHKASGFAQGAGGEPTAAGASALARANMAPARWFAQADIAVNDRFETNRLALRDEALLQARAAAERVDLAPTHLAALRTALRASESAGAPSDDAPSDDALESRAAFFRQYASKLRGAEDQHVSLGEAAELLHVDHLFDEMGVGG